MSDFIKQDIFFFLASILTVVITVVLLIGGYYVVKILRAINIISQKAKDESEILAEDLSDLRTNIKAEGKAVKHLFNFFSSVHKKNKKR